MKINIESVDKSINKLLSVLYLSAKVLGICLGIYYIILAISPWSVINLERAYHVPVLSLLLLYALVVSICQFLVGFLSYFKQKSGKEKLYAKGMILKSIAGMLAIVLIYFFSSVISIT